MFTGLKPCKTFIFNGDSYKTESLKEHVIDLFDNPIDCLASHVISHSYNRDIVIL
jgi:hypothetical protein